MHFIHSFETVADWLVSSSGFFPSSVSNESVFGFLFCVPCPLLNVLLNFNYQQLTTHSAIHHVAISQCCISLVIDL